MTSKEKCVWKHDDLVARIETTVRKEVCEVMFTEHAVKFLEPVVDIGVLKEIVYHWEEMSKVNAMGMRPVDDDEDIPF